MKLVPMSLYNVLSFHTAEVYRLSCLNTIGMFAFEDAEPGAWTHLSDEVWEDASGRRPGQI